MKFFNFWDISETARNADELVLLTYGAIFSGHTIGYKWEHIETKLNIRIQNYDLMRAYFRRHSRNNIVSTYPPNEPHSFVNPWALQETISSQAKASYIRLAASVTADQRWNFKLWQKPLIIPRIFNTHPDIPEEWVIRGQTHLRMKMEEDFYGKRLERN